MRPTPAQLEAIAPDWLEFVRAAEWGVTWVRPPVAERLDDLETFIHHGGGGRFGTDARQAMRSIQAWFQRPKSEGGKGYSTIGYDVMVHRDTSTERVAILGAREGALSAATLHRNDIGEAICLFGNFHPGSSSSEQPTGRELEALAFAVAWSICHGWSAADTRVLGHRDNPAHPGATACPGDYLDPHVEAIGQRAQQLLKAAIPLPPPPPPAAPQWRTPMASLHMLDKTERVVDTRKPGQGRLSAGESFSIPVLAPRGVEPTAAVVTLTLVDHLDGGGIHLSLDAALGTSANNTGPGAPPSANTTLVNVRTENGKPVIKGTVGGAGTVHLIADLIAVIS